MQLYQKNKSISILDPHLFQNALRIKVLAICNLEKINNQYFIRRKTVRNIYNYYREIGVKSVIQKVMSRLRETIRNEKYFSVGIGEIVKSTSELFSERQLVCFIASNHPACGERVVISSELAFIVDAQDYQWCVHDSIVWLSSLNQPRWWKAFLAWSPYSGLPAPIIDDDIRKKITSVWNTALNGDKKYISINSPSVVSEMKSAVTLSAQKTAVLFGYGNYAKTMLMPNLNKDIRITRIHEIDPTQLLPLRKNIIYDTSPHPKENTDHDVYFIAGYHHTHADIAIEGIKKNKDVVVEKPLMTTKAELEKIISAMKNSSSDYYACFQRRYHRFNDYFFQDAQLKKGDPISYFAIIYEESLPEFHWYRWPNSRSAIISNGCHWIDHFLFLNNYCPILTSSAQKTAGGDIVIIVSLQNKATLSLTLSHTGSSRIGMQEYVELRSGKNTAKIMNGARYFSENEFRILRNTRIDKFESYKKMYRQISECIVNKKAPRLSDSWQKIDMVSSLILSLDDSVLS